ncbi:MAG: hypothetical protein PHU21_01010 [Elusimicrobia bacterium]|nr:hypothetical protein [Elusimicrobiota bacterium]
MKNTIAALVLAVSMTAGSAQAAGFEDVAANGGDMLAAAGQAGGELVVDFKKDRSEYLYQKLFDLQDEQQRIEEEMSVKKSQVASQLAYMRNDLKVRQTDGEIAAAQARLSKALEQDSDQTVLRKLEKATVYAIDCDSQKMFCQPSYVGGLPYDSCYAYTMHYMGQATEKMYGCVMAETMMEIADRAKELTRKQRELNLVRQQLAQTQRFLDSEKQDQ